MRQNKKITILHIIKTLNLGGAEFNLLNLAKTFNPNKYDIHVAYSGEGKLIPQFKSAEINLLCFSSKPHKIKDFASLTTIIKLIKYIRKHNIQIIQTHTFNAHIWGTIAGRLCGCKVIEHVHDSRYQNPVELQKRGEYSKQYKHIKKFRRLADQVIVLTQENKNFVIQNNIYPANRVTQIYNGLPCDPSLKSKDPHDIRNKYSIPRDLLVSVTPIRFSPEKNLSLILSVIEQVLLTHKNIIFIIAGEGELKNEFYEQCKSKGLLEHIRLPGFVENISELLFIADIFFLPSLLELHSIAILEAMRMAIPIIVSSNVGSNDEFIQNGVNGILENPFKVDGWVTSIINLIENKEKRSAIGQEGYQTFCSKFDIEKIIPQIESVYTRVLER